jgi:hypothetical protein
LIVATRPEGATSVFVLGCAAAYIVWKQRRTWRSALFTAFRAGLPAVVLLIVQSIANLLLTGESAANGALVKLALYNPFMSPTDKWNEYIFHLKYCILRNIEHHFSDAIPYGWIPIALAVVALISKRTRVQAAILCSSTVLFILLVATNGQVRWQNERYTMPAVAWLFTAAALGLGVLLSQGVHKAMRSTWLPRLALAAAVVLLYWRHQAPKMKDQIWFFGRACRNIRDQHIVAGRLLRSGLHPTPQRVLVGDAGAMMYSSDLPGLDIIGLGGFHNLPFARAGVAGMGATVELIERIPPEDRPDVMALYPTWWGKFPIWFGKQLTAVWVEGNVICGGAEKAIYKADWHLLNTGAKSFTIQANETVLDELDTGDLVSEKAHKYEFPRPGAGFVDLRILSYPQDLAHDVLDAGRRIPADRSESFQLSLSQSINQARLLVRTAPTHKGELDISWDGRSLAPISFPAVDGWYEISIPVPSDLLSVGPHKLVLTPKGCPDLVDHHVWLVGPR